MDKSRKKDNLKKVALERISILFKEADEIFSKNKELSNKYVKLARKLAMKVNLKMPSNLKRKFCKHCYSYLKRGANLRVRTKNSKVVYYCLDCKKFTRIGLKPKKSK